MYIYLTVSSFFIFSSSADSSDLREFVFSQIYSFKSETFPLKSAKLLMSLTSLSSNQLSDLNRLPWLALLPSHPTRGSKFNYLSVGGGGAGCRGQDCSVPLRYHIPAWLTQHSWNHKLQVRLVGNRKWRAEETFNLTWSSRSSSALVGSPSSWASLVWIMALLTL